jgi:hypothetical protein
VRKKPEEALNCRNQFSTMRKIHDARPSWSGGGCNFADLATRLVVVVV